MESILYSFLAGISTSIGVIFLLIFGMPGKKTLATLLGFAGGIMLAISVFELMPEALEIGDMPSTVVGFLLGVLLMYLLDAVVPHSHLSTPDSPVEENAAGFKSSASPILRTGYLILFGIALHNLPEGLAIGAGLESSPELGLMIAVAIALHNIPEGIAMAGPLKAGGMKNMKIFLFTLAAGLMTPLGAILGHIFFNISEVFVGGSLAFAAGAMIYITNDELIPEANAMHSHLANGGIIAGLLLGFAVL
ncbi:ZIP family metal transporter [Chitinivibrio alkaliphilus]|uniref:Zinc/iron permease n=1 Tax=Chitinivibrio alkaliphilus ACht1 TaxID=1313304 RepID=U7D9W5_9BACT|nr:ZIP family metal transporter [Chitinivibrio alkaliphilus]ERP31220.1 zinc/iron permease [Chitinivibrio alkaliphilus ACht1]